MSQPRTINWGEADVGLDQALRCRCWDCKAYRGYLLRKVALVAMLVGLCFGWAVESGHGCGVQVGEVAAAAEVLGVTWF